MKTLFQHLVCLFVCVNSCLAAQVPEQLAKLLNDPNAKRQSSIDRRYYAEKYAKVTTGDAERIDREASWKKIQDYAKALWRLKTLIEPGQSISDYPGILSHGRISWNNKTQNYCLTLGVHPFHDDDGLGEYGVVFDVRGRIVSTKKYQYPW